MRSKLPQWKKSPYEICSLFRETIMDARGSVAQPCLQTGPFCNINLLHNYTSFFTDPLDPYQTEITACC